MFAVQYSEYGGPEKLSLGEAPEPHAGPGKIRIKVKAASVNPYDWKVLSGMFAQGKPMAGTGVLGFEAAGVVDEVGEGVSGVQVGDEVFGRGSATQAEYAVLNDWAAKHPSVDWAVAASAAVGGETSERGLRLLGITSGSVVFIDGGAGGVGAVAIQFARARGATVIASAGEANQDYLRELGAIPVVYGEGLAERVRGVAPGEISGVFDVAGKTPIEELISLVAEPSQVVTIANYGAGASGARLTQGAESHPLEALRETADLLAKGQLVIKFQTFPFERAAEAYAQSLSGHNRGKLVLVPQS